MNLEKSYEFFNPTKYKDAIHIIGCGSVGATIAENLARLGIPKMELWDFDIVESKNIANQIFVQKDIGTPKTEALTRILQEINPDIELVLHNEGWKGEKLKGFVFLAVDSIEIRRNIAEKNKFSQIKAMFDVRTGLLDAQHFAANWSSAQEKTNFINTMQFTDEEANEKTPMSACHTVLSVCPTIRIIVGFAVANFMNFWIEGKLEPMILANVFAPNVILP